ncbi:ribose-phosphate pyrophosphokinase 4-like [Elysia marginata]|uniref:Ribose-phosphate pyrophosphokinase 4-like n=1 Tax=Elysia marginata TaxID=1093978 RepID=A0AAV4J8Q9_9GAST|nr:ribose-phosphate pyrophosphokinase 4-like [Elysia marginata]
MSHTSSVKGDVVLLYAHPSVQHLARQIESLCDKGLDVVTSNGVVSGSPPAPSSLPESPAKRPVVKQKQFQRAYSLPACFAIDTTSRAFLKARHVEFRNTIQWNSFADGFPNLFIEDVKYMAGKDVIFIGSFHSPAVVFEQLSVLYAFPRYLARSFHFILPYFPTGTMERVDTEGQIATAKTLATLLSAIPLSAKGPAQIIIYDIHALQERFYFSDNVIPRLETAIPLLQRKLAFLEDENLAFAFPDDGAYKRFHLLFPDEEERLIICAKRRLEGNKRIVTVKDGSCPCVLFCSNFLSFGYIECNLCMMPHPTIQHCCTASYAL